MIQHMDLQKSEVLSSKRAWTSWLHKDLYIGPSRMTQGWYVNVNDINLEP